MNSIHKAVLRSFIIMMLVAGLLFTLLGCPSAGPRAPSSGERTRAFTKMDENYFFIYMVVLPASAQAPQSKDEILKYPNVKKRSMPLSRLRFALGSEASAERVYYTEADVQPSLVGNRYVVVHPTTVNPPEDAFDGLTLFYMPGNIGLAELEKKSKKSVNPLLNSEEVADAEEVFLKPGSDYVVYWMADYYIEGNERLGQIRFTTHALERVPDATTPEPPLDPDDEYASKREWARATWGDELLSAAATGILTSFHKNGAGALQNSRVIERVMVRVGEPLFVNFSKIYQREYEGLEQSVWYDLNSQTITLNLPREAREAKTSRLTTTATYTTKPQFVVGVLPEGELSKNSDYDSMELYKLIVPTSGSFGGSLVIHDAKTTKSEPEAKWRANEVRNALTDLKATERSFTINTYKKPPDHFSDDNGAYFH